MSKHMKTYNVSWNFTIEANSEDEAYDRLLQFLGECVSDGDVTIFDIKINEGDAQ